MITESVNNGQTTMFYDVAWTESEIELFSGQHDPPTGEFAEEHRQVIKSEKPGQWRNENNPPLIGIMRILDFPWLRRFVGRKGVQTGMSEALYNFLFKRMATSFHNAILSMETERKTTRVFKQRIIPTIKKMPILTKRFSDNPDDITQYGITLKTGFTLNIAWPNSSSAVSSDPCETVLIDELENYKDLINLEDLKDRVTTYTRTGKIIMISVGGLEEGPITQELNNCDVICDYHVVCPDCGTIQIMTFDNFYWPECEKTPTSEMERIKLANKIERENLARYRCSNSKCSSLWDDYKRNKAVKLGLENYWDGWKPREDIHRPPAIGVQFPSWISPFKSLSKVVSRWLKAQGNPKLLRAWYNKEGGEAHSETINSDDITDAKLYDRREKFIPDEANWQVPMGACLLTGYVDVQGDRLEYEIVAWGLNEECWRLEYGVIYGDPMTPEPWKELDETMDRKFRHESGVDLRVYSYGVDSGDRSVYVYQYVKPRMKRRVIATKGLSTAGSPFINRPKLYSIDDTKKTKNAKFGVPVWGIGTEEGKDLIYSRVLKAEGYGVIHFPKTYDYEYFRQLNSEQAVDKKNSKGVVVQVYQLRPGKKRNEAIDIAVGNLAVYMIAMQKHGINMQALLKEITAIAKKETKVKSKKKVGGMISEGVKV